MLHNGFRFRAKSYVFFWQGPISSVEATHHHETGTPSSSVWSRLASFIKQQQRFSVNRTYLGIDSSSVLQWIRGSDKRQQVFVANRVAEILELTQSTQWKHCPGYLNPVDDGTRGIPFFRGTLTAIGSMDQI